MISPKASEIVAAETQHRNADEKADDGSEDRADDHCDGETQRSARNNALQRHRRRRSHEGADAHKARVAERQLAHHDIPREPFGGQLLGRGQNTQRNGQVVGRSLLADVGRRKVDDDFLAAHFVRAVLECGPDAFLTFSDRVIGQADQIHADAGRDIDLCGDRQCVDTEHRAAMAFDEHTGEMICDTSLGICDLLQVKIREFAENSKWPAALVAQSRRGRP